MADERDPKVSQRYRELGAPEPPRQVDEAILAASRRAAEMHPAPLVPPTGRRRWYFPVAAAAIITLSVAVTWHMQAERPDPEGYVASAPVAVQAPKEDETKAGEERKKAFTPDPPRPAAAPPPGAPAQEREARAMADTQIQAQRSEAARDRRMQESAPVAGARAPETARADRMLGKQMTEPPEKWLERIAELRKQGRHEAADKQLEEFRKRYPDYKIPESALRLPK